jgi:hypothetical protein
MKTEEIKSLTLLQEKYTVEKVEPGKKLETLAISIDFEKHRDSVFHPRLMLTYGLYVPKVNAMLPLSIQVWYELITTDTNFFNNLSTPKVVNLYSEMGEEAGRLLVNHFEKMKHTNERLKDLSIPVPTKEAITFALLSALQILSGN